ncbi:cation transporter [Veronia nyctiphanis]|uniref:Cation transporter n=1 Tax=Veronia nyctiphanis TaxID=1278244 RepID=A0A4Q0YSQ3_9GAMM|nr:cation diffusion facilitator family transporter [Veronia nyctiphanis]RXJ73703.1 cation transporter [Veronia nyctiphanis]
MTQTLNQEVSLASRLRISREKLSLRISLAGTILMAACGLIVGIQVNSQAIMLDGVFSLLSMGMTGLSLYTAHLVSRPEDEQFQFGYTHLEPLITVINGLVILMICGFAFYSGITALFTEGTQVELDVALSYAVFSTFLCFGIFFTERYISKEVQSELVRVDSQEWLVDGILSATILIGFIAVATLDGLGHSQWNNYIDPILVSALSLAAAMLPVSVLRRNLKEVLLITPNNKAKKRVDRTLLNIAEHHDFKDYSCHFVKVGRRYDLEVNILIDDPDEWPIERQDQIREVINSSIVRLIGDTWLSVSFTAKSKWL